MARGNSTMIDLTTIRPFLDDQHLELAEKIDDFVHREIAPLPAPEDDAAARDQAKEILALLGGDGWLMYSVPAAHGGDTALIDLRACCLIREALAWASPLADAIFSLQCLGSLPIAIAGSDELKKRWLPDVAAGRAMAAFAMTELRAGSDVGALETRARRVDEGYVLTGRKLFISNAGLADFYTVFARTEGDRGTQGISIFLVGADTPGLRFVRPQVLSAPHPLGEIAFDDCRVASNSRIGKEGEGFKIGMRTLDRLRATVGAGACGMGSRALDEALAHAKEREQFGRPLADFQLTQQKLARMATDLTAARLLVYRAASEADRGAERVTLESSMAKYFATEAAQRIVDDAVQILGGKGVLAFHPVDRLYRSVRALRIYEGTTEIQQLVIARELLKSSET